MRTTGWLLALAIVLTVAPATAQSGPVENPTIAPTIDPTPRQGRGFTWSGGIVVPILVGDLRYAEADALVPFYSPGGGIVGRIGWELPEGLAILGVFSLYAFSVEAQSALLLYRGALELRWTIDTGTVFLPFVAAGGDAYFYVRDGELGSTGGVHAHAGLAIELAWWAQLEALMEVQVAFPGAAFRDTATTLVPSLGGTFFF